MANSSKNDDFLSSEEKYIFEEIKFIQKLMSDDNNAYSRWESWFIAAEAILLASVIQNGVSNNIRFIFIIFGIVISLIFFINQNKNYSFAKSRISRWKELENMLNKKYSNKSLFMKILETQNKDVKHRKIWRLELNSWNLRISISIIFLVLWTVLAYFLV